MADRILAKDESTYERPPEGGHAAVCVDVIDLGYRYNAKWNKVEPKCAIIFQLAAKSEKTGRRFEVSNVLTVSFGEKANLRKFLAAWREKSYTEAEAKAGAPLHKLEGQPAYIIIEHKPVGEKTYANIINIMKLPVGLPILAPEDYRRSENWKKTTAAEADAQKFAATIPGTPPVNGAPHPAESDDFSPAQLEDTDDDLPF